MRILYNSSVLALRRALERGLPVIWIDPRPKLDGVAGVGGARTATKLLNIPRLAIIANKFAVRNSSTQLTRPSTIPQVEPTAQEHQPLVPGVFERLQRLDRSRPPVATDDYYFRLFLIRKLSLNVTDERRIQRLSIHDLGLRGTVVSIGGRRRARDDARFF